MTTPSSTPSDAAAVVAASPVLGPQPDRFATGGYVEGPADTEPTVEAAAGEDVSLPNVLTYHDEDGRVHYASPYSKATRDHLAAGEWMVIDAGEPPFDPAGQRVRDVVAYLEQHAGDQAEIERVKAAEAAGENRPTIASWSPDPQ